MSYGTLEIEIMNAVWELHSINEDANISVSDIVGFLGESSIERAYTTIKTVMDRLVSKDILVRYKSGKKYFYKSTVDRNEAARKAVEEVSNQFFGGSYSKMIRFIEKKCEKILA